MAPLVNMPWVNDLNGTWTNWKTPIDYSTFNLKYANYGAVPFNATLPDYGRTGDPLPCPACPAPPPCPPCTKPHVEDHPCPTPTPCPLAHLKDHTCPPCTRKHADDVPAPVPTPAPTPIPPPKENEGDDGKSKGNNGVGNGVDPAPPGNPKENDGEGSAPGNPGNKKDK